MLEVRVQDNNVEKAIKALKRKLTREGVFRQLKEKRWYEKPSDLRRLDLLELDRLAEAENDFSASLRINPRQPTAYSLRGTARLGQEKLGWLAAPQGGRLRVAGGSTSRM